MTLWQRLQAMQVTFKLLRVCRKRMEAVNYLSAEPKIEITCQKNAFKYLEEI